MTILHKILAGLVLLGVSFAVGLFYGRGQREVIVTEGKTVVEVVERVRTVIVEKRPDGTVITTTKEEDKQANSKASSSSSASKKAPLPQYGVGVAAVARFNDLTDYQYSATVSRRMLGPVWIELQGNAKQIGLGVRVEF